ncbi:mobile mystery protein A [Tardiphaga sp. 42S5]|uniref:mobile mystery protein A n=1 Tax=Tardiphaga sp. 42S5 TaxID=1404799 RepID=UPI002A5991C1|nr:mobile mystery protein A [Tardiphaga sp. 42S5]WPO42198.1 mobile mystery protein A [Tardiphaga sp. 42S5]
MKSDTRKRARERLDERLAPLKPAERFRAPPKGWVRAIRDALGMSGVQFARRLRVQPPSVAALEASEESGAIQLNTLRRAAEALDCTVVYAFVPNDSLEGAVSARARKLALRDLGRAAHTMKLEAQGTPDSSTDERLEAYIRDKLRERDLWNEP